MKIPLLNPRIGKTLLLSAGLLPFAPLNAAVLYLQADQVGAENWNTVTGSGGWFTATSGGSHPGAMSGSDTYNTNGKALRTGATNSTFAGGMLELNGLGMVLGAATSTVGNLRVAANADLHNGIAASNLTLNVGVLQMDATLTLNSPLSSSRILNLNVTTLQGSANLFVGFTDLSATTALLSATTASAYTGNLVLRNTGSSLTIVGNLTSAGGLDLRTGTVLTLGSNLTFNSLTIGGASLGAGVYSYATLNSTYDSFFANGGSGSITVIPEPASGMLVLSGIASLWLYRRKSKK